MARNGITREALNELKLFVDIPDEGLVGGYNLIVLKAERKRLWATLLCTHYD